jgi:hypothetical protein
MSVDNGAFARPTFCSQPVEGNRTEFRQNSALMLFLQREDDPNGIVEKGFFAFVGAYHAPYWTEAVLNSEGKTCEAVT